MAGPSRVQPRARSTRRALSFAAVLVHFLSLPLLHLAHDTGRHRALVGKHGSEAGWSENSSDASARFASDDSGTGHDVDSCPVCIARSQLRGGTLPAAVAEPAHITGSERIPAPLATVRSDPAGTPGVPRAPPSTLGA